MVSFFYPCLGVGFLAKRIRLRLLARLDTDQVNSDAISLCDFNANSNVFVAGQQYGIGHGLISRQSDQIRDNQ